jgi:hypothetical protein
VTTAEQHLTELDAAAPGLVVGAHVVGSAVLDDHVPGESDLDLVCELAGAPDPAVLAAAQRPDLDVVYVPAGELARPVDAATTLAWGREGTLHTATRGDLTPVLWEQLRGYSRTVRGERPSPPVDRAEVRQYCRTNLATYWRPQLAEAAVVLGRAEGTAPFRTGVLWVAPGPARLWHTIATGGIVGKTRALHLAAARWPELAAPLREIAAARRDPAVALGRRHAGAALRLGELVLAEVG